MKASAAASLQRVPRLDRDVRILHLADRTVVLRRTDPREGQVVLRNPPPAELARVLGAIDGARTVAEVCEALAEAYASDDVIAVLEALEGVVLRFDAAAGPGRGTLAPVTIVGHGALARELAAALAAPREVHVLWTGDAPPPAGEGVSVEAVAPEAVATRVAGHDVVIAVHERGTLGDALALNRALLAAGIPCIHVTGEPDTLVVGPTTVPHRTPCLECANIHWLFKLIGPVAVAGALDAVPVAPPLEPRTRAAVVAAVAARLDAELTGLRRGRPYPALLGGMVRVSLDGPRTIDLVPTTACTSCHGCNPGGVTHGLRPDAIPAPRELGAAPASASGPGRSVDLAEASRRIEAALGSLGIEVTARGYSRKLRTRYPALAALPFVHASPRITYRPDAPFVVARPPAECFGKGATTAQALCSSEFELLERLALAYRGGVEVLRAPYAEVREHALDMAAFTAGVLAVPDRGPRGDFDPAVPIDWCWGQSLRTGRPRLVPAHTVLLAAYGRESGPTLCTFHGSQLEMPLRGSSGVAAGATLEDAVLQGVYEVIEHDARLLHQRSGLEAPVLDPASIDDPEARRVLDVIDAAGFDVQLRYLTVDVAVPIVEAYLTSRKDLTFHRLPGWGVHHDPAIAVRRALTEAVQCLGAAEAVRPQTFARGEYALTNTFHETRFAVERRRGVVRYEALPRAHAAATSTRELLDAAVAALATALPAIDLCFYPYPLPGLDGVHVVAVVATHVINNLTVGHVVQDRLRGARRLRSPDAPVLELPELYLGALKT